MKLIVIILALLSSSLAFGQIPPAEAGSRGFKGTIQEQPAPPPPELPNKQYPMVAPNAGRATINQSCGSEELRNLISLQTEAIKALSKRVDALERQHRKINNGGP